MLIQVDKRVSEEQEYKRFIDALAREIKSGHQLKQFLYEKKRLEKLGRANDGAAAYVEGLGQLKAQYDADMWFQARQADENFWRDEQNIKNYKRDNPEVIVTK